MSCFGGIVSIISQRGSLPHDFFWTMLKELFKLHRLFKVFCSRWTACLSRERLHLFFHGWLAYTFRWFGMFLLPFILCSMFLGHESIIVGNPNGMPTYIRLCVSVCYRILLQRITKPLHMYTSATHIHTIAVHMYTGKDCQLFTSFGIFFLFFVLALCLKINFVHALNSNCLNM